MAAHNGLSTTWSENQSTCVLVWKLRFCHIQNIWVILHRKQLDCYSLSLDGSVINKLEDILDTFSISLKGSGI